MYCKLTLIRNDFISRSTQDKLVRNDYNSRSRFTHTLVLIRQNLVRAENCSRQKGSRESRKNLSHANKGWFTVL